jgi:hypothetical protein
LTAFGISLAKQKEFRFSIYAGDCISQQSIRRFLPKSNSVTIRLIDHEGRISIPVTQGIGKANSASRLIFPSLLWSDTTSTGVALVNLLTDTVLNTFCYFDNSGNLLATGSNPASRSLFPGRQTAFFANEVLNAGPSSDGWLEVRSSADKLAGFFLEGDFAKGTYLDGTSAATEGIRQSYLPVILLSGGKSQQFLVVNPEPNAAQVTLRAFKSTGEMVYSTLKAIPVHGRISESLTSLLSAAGAGIIDGYLEVQANQPVSTLSKISTADALAMFAGMTPAPGNRLCGVQFATGQEYQTYLNLINTGNTASTVALTLRNADGTALATKSDLRISAKGSLQAEVGALFGLPLLSGRLYQGWLTIDFGSEAIIGLSTVAGRGPGSFITSLPLIATFQKQYVLPHVAMLDGYYTGLGLLNPDSLRATLRIQVFDQAGQMSGQSLLSLEPGQRDARLLEQLVSGLRPQNRGYVLLDSDRNIGVVGVFGSTRLDLLSTIPAIPR